MTNKEIIKEVKERYLKGKEVSVEYLDNLIYFQDSNTGEILAIYNHNNGQLEIF